jgi:hypothetical protein
MTSYYSVYSLEAMKNKSFHIICANIPNDSADKKAKILAIYPEKHYHIVEHFDLVNMNVLIGRNS